MRYYLVSWDSLGVEFLEEITEHHPDRWAKDHLFDSIRDGKKKTSKPLGFDVMALKLRARCNSHRHYEIYVFTTDPGIEPHDLRHWFEKDPQEFADWVRENHSYCILDDRAKTPAVIV